MILFSAKWQWRGIQIRCHPIDLLLVALVGFGLARARDTGSGDVRTIATITSLGFIALIALHLGCRLIAARFAGMRVTVITIGLFGNSVETTGPQSTPRNEIRVGIAGAMVSAFGAAACWAVAEQSESFDALGSLALAFFILQLMPSLPLDGGRCLWAMLWPVLDDDVRAARMVHRYGLIVVFGLVLFGIAIFESDSAGAYGTVGACAAAVELAIASSGFVDRREWQRLAVKRKIASIGAATVTTIEASRPIASAVELLLVLKHAGLLVVKDQKPVGAVTQANLRQASRRDWEQLEIGSIMTPISEIPELDPDLDVSAAIDVMRAHRSTIARTTLATRPALVTEQGLLALDFGGSAVADERQ